MSNTVTINTWDGGHAEDIRTTASNECESVVNFDILTNPHKLIPYSDPVAETSSGTITDYTITDVAILNVSGTATIYGMGRKALADQSVEILKKSSTSDITSAWSLVASNANVLTPGTLIEYKDILWFITGGSTWSKFVPPSTITALTTFAAGYTSNFAPKPFRHPVDDSLYFALGERVYKFTNASPYATATLMHTLATNFEIQSLTDWGNYLAVGGSYLTNSKRSAVYLSNRDVLSPNNLPTQVIDWGEGKLAILENIGGTLIGISYTENVGSYTTQNSYRMFIKAYSGGTVETIKEIVTGTTADIRVWKSKSGDKLYFGFDADSAMYVLARNKSGRFVVAKNRYYNPSGSSISGASGLLTGLSVVGDVSFTSYGDSTTDGYLARQGAFNTVYTLPSRYTTTINPKMVEADRTKKKSLLEIRISYTVSTANGTVNVYIYRDGGASKLALTKTQTSTGEYVTYSYKYNDSQPFENAYEFQFLLETTGNVSIKEFKYIYDNIPD